MKLSRLLISVSALVLVVVIILVAAIAAHFQAKKHEKMWVKESKAAYDSLSSKPELKDILTKARSLFFLKMKDGDGKLNTYVKVTSDEGFKDLGDKDLVKAADITTTVKGLTDLLNISSGTTTITNSFAITEIPITPKAPMMAGLGSFFSKRNVNRYDSITKQMKKAIPSVDTANNPYFILSINGNTVNAALYATSDTPKGKVKDAKETGFKSYKFDKNEKTDDAVVCFLAMILARNLDSSNTTTAAPAA